MACSTGLAASCSTHYAGRKLDAAKGLLSWAEREHAAHLSLAAGSWLAGPRRGVARSPRADPVSRPLADPGSSGWYSGSAR